MFSLFWNSLWFIHWANSVLLLPCCPLRGGTNLTPHYTSLKFIQMAEGSSGTTGPNWTCCAKGAMQGAKITERKQLDQKLIYKWGRTRDDHPSWVIWSSGQFWVSRWIFGISMHLMVDFTSQLQKLIHINWGQTMFLTQRNKSNTDQIYKKVHLNLSLTAFHNVFKSNPRSPKTRSPGSFSKDEKVADYIGYYLLCFYNGRHVYSK